MFPFTPQRFFIVNVLLCFPHDTQHNNINKRWTIRISASTINAKQRQRNFFCTFSAFLRHNTTTTKRQKKEATRTEGEEKLECSLRPSVRLWNDTRAVVGCFSAGLRKKIIEALRKFTLRSSEKKIEIKFFIKVIEDR